MIRRDDGRDWLLIPQPAHAALCGVFAERWGRNGGPFAPPDPLGPVVLAAREHDTGWADWEVVPSVDPATGRPRHFTEVPALEWLPVWHRGVARVAERDAYAGFLVSLHATRLVQRRHGAGQDGPEGRAALERTLEEFAAYQAAERIRLGLAEAVVRAHSRLVAVWDWISLILCCGPIRPTTIEEVPAGDGAAILSVTPAGERGAALDPYPFAGGPLAVTAPARRIPARPYRSSEDLRAALAAAPAEHLDFTLRPA
jgi:hypothetical protein